MSCNSVLKHATYFNIKNNPRLSEAVVQRCSVKKRVLKNFAKFTGKHLCLQLINPICTGGAQICAPLWKVTRCRSNFAASTLCFTDFN